MFHRKSILLITDVMYPGGVDTYITQLIDYGIKHNWNITLLLDKNSKTFLPQMVKDKCKIVFKDIYHKTNSEIIINKNFSTFLKELDNIGLAHIICGTPWSCIVIREILIDFKFRIINTEQYVYNNMSFTNDQIERIKNIYDKTYKIIFVEESNLSYMRNIFGEYMNGNFCVINNSVDVKSISSNAITLQDRINKLKRKFQTKDKIKFLLVGRLAYQKGFDILIKAVYALTEDIKSRAKFDIYGSGTEYLNLTKMIKNRSLSNYIEIHDWVKNVSALFSNYDIFVFPSRTEGLSFTLLEALSSNMPCIVSNIPSNIVLSKNGYYTEIFDISDVHSLTSVLSDWINYPLDKIANIPNSHDWMMQNFNSKKTIKKTLDLWDNAYIK
jgi:glycosyltransferase involved in cell wall biosynthesis